MYFIHSRNTETLIISFDVIKSYSMTLGLSETKYHHKEKNLPGVENYLAFSYSTLTLTIINRQRALLILR